MAEMTIIHGGAEPPFELAQTLGEEQAALVAFKEGIQRMKNGLADVGKRGGIIIPSTATIIAGFPEITGTLSKSGFRGMTLLAKLRSYPQPVQERFTAVMQELENASRGTCYSIAPGFARKAKWRNQHEGSEVVDNKGNFYAIGDIVVEMVRVMLRSYKIPEVVAQGGGPFSQFLPELDGYTVRWSEGGTTNVLQRTVRGIIQEAWSLPEPKVVTPQAETAKKVPVEQRILAAATRELSGLEITDTEHALRLLLEKYPSMRDLEKVIGVSHASAVEKLRKYNIEPPRTRRG